MGCGGSKEESNPNEIKSEMKPTKVPELDDFFKSASEFLENLESLRSGFQDTREEMNEIGRTDELVKPSLAEAIKVFLWAVSAEHNGNIKASNIKFSHDPPAFNVDASHMDHKTYDFSQAFKELIGALSSAPGKIQSVGSQSKEIGEKANALKSDVKAKIDASGLNPMEKVKAAGAAATNFATVLKGVAKAPEVGKQSQETLNDIRILLPEIVTLIAGADTVGKEAADKHHKKIDEIFDHYQKAEKKSAEQIKEAHKGKKPLKKRARKAEAKPETAGKTEEHKKAEEHKAEGEHKAEHA